ncbi:unnamed protein product [Oikopleura dioica]|uniref:Uncharacterized protein n=1 Tax=Oikopleura dioica TaxID=34765 RepID=E4Y0T5_OIKDI|nr:unnamed protein product [Oikopleura dioica]
MKSCLSVSIAALMLVSKLACAQNMFKERIHSTTSELAEKRFQTRQKKLEFKAHLFKKSMPARTTVRSWNLSGLFGTTTLATDICVTEVSVSVLFY